MSEPKKPSAIARLRAQHPWLDHVIRAYQRFSDAKGDFFAAGITYFTVFALFPLAMVGFAIGGFVLASRPQLLAEIDDWIKATVSGEFGQQLVKLMDSAIDSRTSVGVIGLATAAWAGLGWMANLREALTAMWDQRGAKGNFVRTKVSDLVALVSLFAAILVTLGVTALGSAAPTVLRWLGVHDSVALGVLLHGASVLLSLVVSWLLFTWTIARLPREPLTFVSAIRAGLLAAVGFEIFKQLGSIYLRSVLGGPAGATFGSILGLMVFAYITARLVLFATAWAATSAENMALTPVAPPGPVVIQPRVHVDEGASVRRTVAAASLGALAALGISWVGRRRD